jgi:hypothetical protein
MHWRPYEFKPNLAKGRTWRNRPDRRDDIPEQYAIQVSRVAEPDFSFS